MRIPVKRSGSRRVEQRNTQLYQSSIGTNCVLKSLNFLYNSQANINTLTSFPPSLAQQRLHSHISTSVDEFYSLCRRAHVDCGSDNKEEIKFTQKSWNLYIHFVATFANLSIQFNQLHTVLEALTIALPKSEREWAVQTDPDDQLQTPTSIRDRLPMFSIDRAGSSHSSNYFGPGKASRAVVPLLADRVSLPSRLNHVSMLDVLSETDQLFYSSQFQCLRADFHPSELALLNPPTFGGPRPEYVKLLKRLLQLKMISFTSQPKAVNGLFGVEKDANNIRLIINAKPANLFFKPPPPVQLPSPSHLGRLYSDRSERFWIAKCDLESYYHQIRVPDWLQPYLALPSLTSDELSELGMSSSSPIYPMCNTLPMGWSHAVYIAHSIHEHTLYSYRSGPYQFHPSDNLLFLQSPKITGAVHAVVIDDLVIVSDSKEECDRADLTAQLAYKAKDFLLKTEKHIPATTETVEAFGHEVDSTNKSIRLSPRKSLQLIIRTMKVLCLSEITGLELSSLIGDWLWTLLLHRPSLAILSHSYRFISMAKESSYQIWPSVRRELILLLLVFPLISARLSCPWFPDLIATDACNTGGAVVQSPLSSDDFNLLWPITASRHSLYFVMQQLSDHQRRKAMDQFDSAIAHIEFGEDISLEKLLSESPLIQPAVRYHLYGNSSFIPQLPAPLSMAVNPTIVGPTISETFYEWLSQLQSIRPWSTLIATPWSYSQHINALELQSIVLAVRHVVSSPLGQRTRLLVLSDSAVVTHTLLKGRSSSRNLVAGMRKIAALTLASGCTIQPCWIPTQFNPADEPSRRFETRTRA